MKKNLYQQWLAFFLIIGILLPHFARAEDTNIDLLPPPKLQPVSSELDQSVKTRRAMLQWHQGLGIAMATLLAGTVAVGQLNYNDTVGSDTGKWNNAHHALVGGTVLTFVASGILGLFAPEPYQKKEGFDTTAIHTWTMAVAAALMVTEGILGVMVDSKQGKTDPYLKTHLALGYGTLGVTLLGATIQFF